MKKYCRALRWRPLPWPHLLLRACKSPFFKKVLDSQREYAAKVVPAKRFMFPPYSFAANDYFPEKPSAGAPKGKSKDK
jgi:hypothetical protein